MDNPNLRNNRLMTLKEMAAYLQVTERTVQNMAADGRVEKWQPGGKGYTARYYLKGEKQ